MKSPINVFIDTSIFKQKGFSVNQTVFNTLRFLCQSKKIKLLSTDITQSEIESNILKSIKGLKTEWMGVRNVRVKKQLFWTILLKNDIKSL